MRILVLCHEHHPIGGGAAAVAAALARDYVTAGHEVVFATMGFADLPDREVVDGYEIHRIACNRRRKDMASPGEGLRWAWQCWPVVRRLHQRQNFDMTHAHFIMPAGIVAGRLKRRFGVPFVITSHGSDVPGYNRERLKFAHKLAGPWWRAICRQADRVVSPSKGQQQLIHAATSDAKTRVIENGIALGRFQAGNKERRMLLCSRLVERKGFHTFLQAIAELEAPGWEIDLVGDGPMREALNVLATRCRIPVRMLGWIDNDDQRLAELYARAAIFVFPSEWENFPVALLEAMSAGCAVMASNAGGNPDAVGDAGILIGPYDQDAWRDVTRRLTSDWQQCQALGRRAYDRVVSQFDIKIIANRYLSEFASHVPGKTESVQAVG